jgi:hypothetical protein
MKLIFFFNNPSHENNITTSSSQHYQPTMGNNTHAGSSSDADIEKGMKELEAALVI